MEAYNVRIKEEQDTGPGAYIGHIKDQRQRGRSNGHLAQQLLRLTIN